jgi:hypothetical protein
MRGTGGTVTITSRQAESNTSFQSFGCHGKRRASITGRHGPSQLYMIHWTYGGVLARLLPAAVAHLFHQLLKDGAPS